MHRGRVVNYAHTETTPQGHADMSASAHQFFSYYNASTLDTLRETALKELERATGKTRDSDDVGMLAGTVGMDDLIRWVDDLEDRCGYCVDDFRSAIHDFIDVSETLRAIEVMRPMERSGWIMEPLDARGAAYAGIFLKHLASGEGVWLALDENADWSVEASDMDGEADIVGHSNKVLDAEDIAATHALASAHMARIDGGRSA